MRYTYFGVLAIAGTFWAIGRIETLEAFLASFFYVCGIELVQRSRSSRHASKMTTQRVATASQWRNELVNEARRHERTASTVRKDPPQKRRHSSVEPEHNLRGYAGFDVLSTIVVEPPSPSSTLFAGGGSGGAGGGAAWEPSSAESTGSCSSTDPAPDASSGGGDCASTPSSE